MFKIDFSVRTFSTSLTFHLDFIVQLLLLLPPLEGGGEEESIIFQFLQITN
jgi:hypothetical protein